MSPEQENDQIFGYEPEYVLEVVKRMLERQKPGIDKTAAVLYWNLRELIKALPNLKDKLDELSKEPEKEHGIEFDIGKNHWQYITNKNNRSGDFRLARTGEGEEEEAMIIIGKKEDNTFAYWNKRFAVPSGRKIFRGPNKPAAKKIQSMITKLAIDSLS